MSSWCALANHPPDGDVIEGAATVDESAITGESAPVIRESGGDRSAVTGGTRVLSDEIKIRVSINPGEGSRPHDLAGRRRETPEDAERNRAHHSACALTFIFLLVCVTLKPFAFIPPRCFPCRC